MLYMELIFGLLVISYLGVAVYYYIRWNSIPMIENKPSNLKLPISLIIPVRNESNAITSSIKHLLSQLLEHDELLIINDHSTDDTEEQVFKIIHDLADNRIVYHSLTIEEGKKAAISLGVEIAKNEWISCIDADCDSHNDRLEELRMTIENTGANLIFGPVLIKGKSYWTDFQQYELSALVGIGAVSNHMGFPTMINGANMSFKRSVFKSVGGYAGNEQLATGDDEFLMKKIAEIAPGSIYFLKSKKGFVFAEASPGIKELIHQKRRWASKWNKGNNATPALLVFLFYVGIIGCMGFLMFRQNWGFLFAGFGVKMLADFIFIQPVISLSGSKMRFFSFLFSEIVYPFYAIIIGILANFGEYKWKERNHKV